MKADVYLQLILIANFFVNLRAVQIHVERREREGGGGGDQELRIHSIHSFFNFLISTDEFSRWKSQMKINNEKPQSNKQQ